MIQVNIYCKLPLYVQILINNSINDYMTSLLNYPIKVKRLSSHFNHFLMHLNYPRINSVHICCGNPP